MSRRFQGTQNPRMIACTNSTHITLGFSEIKLALICTFSGQKFNDFNTIQS